MVWLMVLRVVLCVDGVVDVGVIVGGGGGGGVDVRVGVVADGGGVGGVAIVVCR